MSSGSYNNLKNKKSHKLRVKKSKLFRSANRGQFVIITALLIAALTLIATISIHEINIHRQSITYRPVNEFLLGTTSDLNRALTVALANYTDGIRNKNLPEAVANENATQIITTWKNALITAYSNYGLRINPPSLIPSFKCEWGWNNNSVGYSYASIRYNFDVDSYGFKGWVGTTEKYVKLQIFSDTVQTTSSTGPTSLIFRLTQSEVNGNYTTPISDFFNLNNANFRIGAYNINSELFNIASSSAVTYLGAGNYSVTFNQAIDLIHKGLRIDLATPKDEIWISAINNNGTKASTITSTILSNSTITLGGSITDNVTVAGMAGAPLPTGTVRFEYRPDLVSDWTAFDSKTLVSGNASSGSFAPFYAGTWYFRAVYSGDDNYNGSLSGDIEEPLIVDKATPTVITLLSARTIMSNATVNDTATVTGIGGDFPIPSGSVTFQVSTNGSLDNSNWTQVGAVKTLSDGSATSDSYSPPGVSNSSVSYFFRAYYAGDSNYTSKWSGNAEEPLTVIPVPPPANTTTKTTLSNSNITLGQSITDVANVTGFTSAESGNVTFQVKTPGSSIWVMFGSVKTLNGSGQALSDIYTPFSAGSYYFRAVYSGDNNHAASQSGETEEPLTVNKASSTTRTSLFPASIVFHQNITDTATISGVLGGPTPTGTVIFQFSVNSNSWTPFGTSKTLSGGSAISNVYTPFSAGRYYFRANYSGDNNYLPSSSGPLEEILDVKMISNIGGTFYIEGRQDSYLSNTPPDPADDKFINPFFNKGSGHQERVIVTSAAIFPSIITSNIINMTYAIDGGKEHDTLSIHLDVVYNGTYYSIGNASITLGTTPTESDGSYLFHFDVTNRALVTGFPVQVIPEGANLVLTTTVEDPSNRMKMYMGLVGTRIDLFPGYSI